MAARVTGEEVKALFNTEVIDGNQIKAFITTANLLVDATLLDEGYPEALLAAIELHLAAHFASLRDRQVSSNQNVTFQGKTGLGLEGSLFGQAALDLDYHGVLRRNKDAKGPSVIEALP